MQNGLWAMGGSRSGWGTDRHSLKARGGGKRRSDWGLHYTVCPVCPYTVSGTLTPPPPSRSPAPPQPSGLAPSPEQLPLQSLAPAAPIPTCCTRISILKRCPRALRTRPPSYVRTTHPSPVATHPQDPESKASFPRTPSPTALHSHTPSPSVPNTGAGGGSYGAEFLCHKFCAKFLRAICSVFLRSCTGIR